MVEILHEPQRIIIDSVSIFNSQLGYVRTAETLDLRETTTLCDLQTFVEVGTGKLCQAFAYITFNGFNSLQNFVQFTTFCVNLRAELFFFSVSQSVFCYLQNLLLK